MTTAQGPPPPALVGAGQRRRPSARRVFVGLLGRDLTVLGKNMKQFLPGTIIQPLLLVFVFTYVFPRIGLGIGSGIGSGDANDDSVFPTLLVPGLVAQSIIFVGVFSVGLNLVRELDTDELEDMVLAPAPVAVVAFAKVAAGAVQSLLAAAMVFPVAALVPATPANLEPDWLVLATVLPLSCITSAALGLTLGTLFEARSANWLVSMVAVPLSFFGAIFYTWGMLDPIPWLQYVILVNPLVYVSEGLRGGLSGATPHMSLTAVYLALATAAGLFTRLGVRGFKRRVLS